MKKVKFCKRDFEVLFNALDILELDLDHNAEDQDCLSKARRTYCKRIQTVADKLRRLKTEHLAEGKK